MLQAVSGIAVDLLFVERVGLVERDRGFAVGTASGGQLPEVGESDKAWYSEKKMKIGWVECCFHMQAESSLKEVASDDLAVQWHKQVKYRYAGHFDRQVKDWLAGHVDKRMEDWLAVHSDRQVKDCLAEHYDRQVKG